MTPAWDSFPPVSEWQPEHRLQASPGFKVLTIHSAVIDGHVTSDVAKEVLRQMAADALRSHLDAEAALYLRAVEGC